MHLTERDLNTVTFVNLYDCHFLWQDLVYFEGVDDDYDQRLHEYFYPYHSLVDMYIRLYVNMLHEEEGDDADMSKELVSCHKY